MPLTGDPNATVCIALANVMPCGTPTPVTSRGTTSTSGTTNNSTASTGTTTNTPTSQPVSVASIFSSIFGGGSSSNSNNRNFTANVSQGFMGKTQKNLAVVLVKAPDHPEIYRIIGGKKFLIPNDAVFDSYGYLRSDIKTMTWAKIMSYPRVKLVKIDSDSSIYYLTEGGMTRRIISQTVFDSYADSDQDVVVINKTEFSLYPQNIYIFNEATYTFGHKPNVYLVGNGTKKLVFPDELAHNGITNEMIAPVNQTEFTAYQTILAVSAQQKRWYQFF